MSQPVVPKVRVKRKHPESELQQACVKWARYQYRILRKMLFAIPNGGKRSQIEASIMKGEGVVSGVADLFISLPAIFPDGKMYCGFYIEMKAPGVEKEKEGQSEWLAIASEEGYLTAVINNFDDFKVAVSRYMQYTNHRLITA